MWNITRDNDTLETHECVLEIIFNCAMKFSTCCLSLIVHPDDDLFVSILNATFRPSSIALHDFFRSSDNFSFFFFSFFFSLDPGGKSRRFSQAVRDGRSRGAVSRLLLVWPTAVRFPSSSAAEFRSLLLVSGKAPAGGKNDRLYLLGICTLAVLVVYLRNAMNTGDISSR